MIGVISKRLGLIISVLFLAASPSAAQKRDVFSNIEKVFRTKEPTWRLEKVLPGQSQNPVSESIMLRQGTKQASIDVWIWLTVQDAHEMFTGQVIAMDNTRGTKTNKRNLTNLGDENYMWTNPHSEAWPTINFRQGNVFVSVFAPTVPVAERFAHYVLEQVAEPQ